MGKNKKKTSRILLLLLIIAGIAYLLFGDEEKGTYVSYADFYEAVEAQKIESAVIDTDRVEFKKYADTTINKFETLDNQSASRIRNSF